MDLGWAAMFCGEYIYFSEATHSPLYSPYKLPAIKAVQGDCERV